MPDDYTDYRAGRRAVISSPEKGYPMRFLVAALCMSVAPLTAASLSQSERDELLKALDRSAKVFADSLAGVSEVQWKFKAAPDRWSILECAEHVAVADQMMFTFASQQLGKIPPAKDPQRRSDEAIRDAASDRSHKVKTAEFLEPKARYATPADALAAFRKSRDAVAEYVRTTQDDLRSRGIQSPNGYVDGYQFLLSLAVHAERHSAQIAEVKADAGYPK